MDILVKEINGKDTVWYSQAYIEKQMQNAYQVGLINGCKIQVCSIQPFDHEHENEIAQKIKSVILKEYNETVGRVIK